MLPSFLEVQSHSYSCRIMGCFWNSVTYVTYKILGILGVLPFHKFYNQRVDVYDKSFWDFDWIYIISVDQCGEKVSLPIIYMMHVTIYLGLHCFLSWRWWWWWRYWWWFFSSFRLIPLFLLLPSLLLTSSSFSFFLVLLKIVLNFFQILIVHFW